MTFGQKAEKLAWQTLQKCMVPLRTRLSGSRFGQGITLAAICRGRRWSLRFLTGRKTLKLSSCAADEENHVYYKFGFRLIV
jgi:hypothetical protein